MTICASLLIAFAGWSQDPTDSLQLQPQEEQSEMAVDVIESAEVPDTPAPENVQPEPTNALNMSLMTDVMLALLAIIALVIAWSSRKSLAEFKKQYAIDMETLTANVQAMANEIAERVEDLENREMQQRNQREQRTAPQAKHVTEKSHVMQEAKPTLKSTSTLFLPKPDENGSFARASKEFELGNSIFVLTTTDGVRGKFSVIDNHDVHTFALMMPGENLIRACSGHGIQMSSGMTRIITDKPGEAILENGKWCVSTKAVIHYE